MHVEAEECIIVLNNFSDLMPEIYTGESLDCDVEEFFSKFRQWIHLHRQRFDNDAAIVAGFKYVLSCTALQWFNDIPAAVAPGNLNDLRDTFYEKFRIRETRVEWKKELQSCKYVPGSSSLPMINRFQYICNKLA